MSQFLHVHIPTCAYVRACPLNKRVLSKKPKSAHFAPPQILKISPLLRAGDETRLGVKDWAFLLWFLSLNGTILAGFCFKTPPKMVDFEEI